MAIYQFRNLHQWAHKIQNRQDRTFRGAVNNMIAGIKIVPGINQGGSRIRGTIPYDKKELSDSLRVRMNGTTILSGSGVIAETGKTGEIVELIWTAGHAPYVHDGVNGVPGTFWTEIAAIKWPRYVDSALAKAKAFTR